MGAGIPEGRSYDTGERWDELVFGLNYTLTLELPSLIFGSNARDSLVWNEELERIQMILSVSRFTTKKTKPCSTKVGMIQFCSVQFSHSVVSDSASPWIVARQASLSITNSRSSLKLMSIDNVGDAIQPSHPLSSPSPPSPIPPRIRVFSSESTLCMRWPKYWSFSFNISPSNEHLGLTSIRMDWFDLLAVQGLSRVFSNTTVQKHQFFGTQLYL